jgi:hypothetical protein
LNGVAVIPLVELHPSCHDQNVDVNVDVKLIKELELQA